MVYYMEQIIMMTRNKRNHMHATILFRLTFYSRLEMLINWHIVPHFQLPSQFMV